MNFQRVFVLVGIALIFASPYFFLEKERIQSKIKSTPVSTTKNQRTSSFATVTHQKQKSHPNYSFALTAQSQDKNTVQLNMKNRGLASIHSGSKAEEPRLVHEYETRPNENGIFKKVSVYHTSGKYPLTRVERSYQKSTGGHSVFLAEKKMVADHVLVKIKNGQSIADFETFLSQMGAGIKRKMRGSDTFLVSFSAEDPRVFDDILANLKESNAIEYSQPDYYYSIPNSDSHQGR